MKCQIEIFHSGSWHKAAEFTLKNSQQLSKGIHGSGYLSYLDSYVEKFINEDGLRAISCHYPVNFNVYHEENHWPAFLLDILPSGAARRVWLQQLGLSNGPDTDWQLLISGAGNPPGNIRIGEAVLNQEHENHPGFEKTEIIEQREGFIEYARSHGAPVSGSTGAHGDAPKYLLTQDQSEKWHADGALSDEHAKQHWIVKFPRGRNDRDYQVLRNEAGYMQVAKKLGLRVFQLPELKNDVLFIPRFDREKKGRTLCRYGLESLYSLSRIAEFGAFAHHEVFIEAIVTCCSNPQQELREYLLRDILNVALGNVDNHGRNTAVLKKEDGTVELSPLYDFAPMFLDPQGIARVTRWKENESASLPDWLSIVQTFDKHGVNTEQLTKDLCVFADQVSELPILMKDSGVEKEIIETREKTISNVEKQLRKK